tara:strand:- start:702 stop:896 length:195 start_codon:yes stop_codon:yes gene_type:complete
MTKAELENKTIKELHELLAQKKDSLRQLRFKAKEGQLKTVHTIKLVRTEIAQIAGAISHKAAQQ